MKEFGLTGGIGSGKSTVAAMLADRGAEVIDADEIVRHLQRSGELVFDAMVERWGSTILTSDGEVDRAIVAGIVFSDHSELAALNRIVHPAVREETGRRLDELRNTDSVVVHDHPLLVLPGGELSEQPGRQSWLGLIVVDVSVEQAVARVVATRDMDPDDVRVRIDAQASREDRLGVADFVIDNSGTLEELGSEVDRCWTWIAGRADDHC